MILTPEHVKHSTEQYQQHQENIKNDYWTLVRAVPMDKNTFRKENLSGVSGANAEGYKVIFPSAYADHALVLWFDIETFNRRFNKRYD